MSASAEKTPNAGRPEARETWEPMRLDYLGHVTELVGADPPGKAITTAGQEGPLPKSKSPGQPG
jgi:hypothetical protein